MHRENVAQICCPISWESNKREVTHVCHNNQSAALLSDPGLVVYFSTLPVPSSLAPCIQTILTHLQGGVKSSF